MIGPGKFDDICGEVRERLDAEGVLLLVIKGTLGSGFSAVLPVEVLAKIPGILRDVANQMEADFYKED